ncbi:MAG: hypothetical protein WBG86_04435, partial [Polyangiales bacterium]
ATLSAVDYAITGPSGAAAPGRLERVGVGGIAPGSDRTVIWRDSLELSSNTYRLEITARDESGAVLCTTEREVSIGGLLRTEVVEQLGCEGPPTDPIGGAVISLQAPAPSTLGTARVFFATILCGHDNTSVVGERNLVLSGERIADFGAGPIGTRVWTTEFDQIPAGRCRATVTEEFEPAVEACRATLDFTVVPDEITPVTFVLSCER